MTLMPTTEIPPDLSARATALYLAGYGPIPIRTGHKAPEPGGFQGEKNPLPTFSGWWEVVSAAPDTWGNLGVRLPPEIVGVDVDAYDSKTGRDAWAELTAGLPFPETVVVSARFSPGYDGLSGIRLYRLPDGVDQSDLWGAHDGIELLRFGHRYLLAPGSAHPSGSTYLAFDVRTREFLDHLPPAGALPMLSPAQARRLTKDGAPWASPGHSRVSRAPSTGAVVPGPRRPHDGPGAGIPACPYLSRLASEAANEIETGSSRHDRMTRATFAIIAAAAEGHRGQDAALYVVGKAFIDAVEGDREGGDSEARLELKRAIEQAQDKIEPIDPMLQACCPGVQAVAEIELWTRRPWLGWADRTGRARGISRFALVGALLARCSAEISPEVKVDSPIGHGRTELGLFCFLLGGSGTSKTSANATVRAAWHWSASELRLGSGEGLAAAYTKRQSGKDPATGERSNQAVRHEWRRYAWVDEYASLISLKERSGQTIAGELRSAWSGERLGMDYRAEEARLPVDAGTYRLAIAAGIQPVLAPDVFAGADVGDLQRWLWFSATDPGLADQPAGEFAPLQPHEIGLPASVAGNAVEMALHTLPGLLLMPISVAIRAEIWTDHQARQTGDIADQDAHRNQTRLRLSAVVALMDGRLEVADDDWDLAGALLLVSDATRARVQADINRRSKDRLRARGEANAEIATGEVEANVRRVALVVVRKIARIGVTNRKQTRNIPPSRDREYLQQALDLAVSLDWLVASTGPADAAGKPGVEYTVGEGWPG